MPTTAEQLRIFLGKYPKFAISELQVNVGISNGLPDIGFAFTIKRDESEKQRAQVYLDILNDRRVLYTHTYHEAMRYARESVFAIRKETVDFHSTLVINSPLRPQLEKIRKACVKMIELSDLVKVSSETDWLNPDSPEFGPLDTNFKSFRSVIGKVLFWIVYAYELTAGDDLSQIIRGSKTFNESLVYRKRAK